MAQSQRRAGARDLARRTSLVAALRIALAIGGNALIRAGEAGGWEQQLANAREIAEEIVALHAAGHELLLTHGNGPQVGALMLQQTLGETEAPPLPLDVLTAMTQGQIGYLLVTAIAQVEPSLPTAVLLTRTLVDRRDPAFATPTIASLMKIAAALGKSVAHFVDEPETPDVMVVRNDERARVYTSKQGLDLRNLSGRYGSFAMAGAEAVVEPLANSGPTPMRHPGEELVIVLEGRMEFTVAGEPHELGPGDSIHFRTVRPHSWRNPTSEPARAIWLVVRAS